MELNKKALLGVFPLVTFVITACGMHSAGHRPMPPGISSTTGAANDAGIPYITTDRRMTEVLKQTVVETEPTPLSQPVTAPKVAAPEIKIPAPAPNKAEPSAPVASPSAAGPKKSQEPETLKPVKINKALSDRLREFEISRFAADSKSPSRFGEKRLTVKIFFTDQATLEFKGELSGKDGKYQFSTTNSHYTLSGTLDDKAPLRSEGDFYLTNNVDNASARILYQAYKAKLTVRRDREKAPATGSETEKRLKELEDQSFGWVHNWAVVKGRSFYIVDIVKVVHTQKEQETPTPSLFAFKGESLRTGDQEHPVQVLTPGFAEDVKLMGNSEEEGLRIVSGEIEDPSNKEKYEFMLDIEEEKANANDDQAKLEKAVLLKDEEDFSDPTLDALAESVSYETPVETNQEAEKTQDSQTEAQAEPEAVDGEVQAIENQPKLKAAITADGASYLRINTRLPRTARMVKDFARNRGLPGVQKQIAAFRGSQKLSNFYYYAYPLRKLMEAIGEAYDVSPSYAYLTVIESAYLTGGRYNNRQKGDYSRTRGEYLAYGPFQFHPESARESGLRVTKASDDERYYFAPSACGAARYVMTLADQFRNSDMTLAILAYNQGGTGAQRLARRYGYSFVRMSRSSLIPRAIRQYVEKKLAVYFISTNMSTYGYDIRRYANRRQPPHNTVIPPRAISNGTCRSVVNSVYSI